MRRDESARAFPLWLIAQACQEVATRIVDAHSRAELARLGIGPDWRTELADIGVRRGLINIQAARPRHVDPLGLKLAIGIEHLHAVVLPIGDVHPALPIRRNIMGYVELARISPRLTPGKQQL